ncbi:MAG: hypothetical protein N2322_01060, partial [Terrimicrobiaceae bacterium]|nr:hypothetical protein [Terrimicrobiaceae bacterium]
TVPSLIDADTLEVAGCRLRLFGIDAVEAYQTCRRNRRTWPCGEAAIAALETITQGVPARMAGASSLAILRNWRASRLPPPGRERTPVPNLMTMGRGVIAGGCL